LFDIATTDPNRLVLEETPSDRVRPAVFAFVSAALGAQLLAPSLSVPRHRLPFFTLFVAAGAGALWLMRPGRFVADRELGRIESSLGWRSLLRWSRQIPFSEIVGVMAVATEKDKHELLLLLASRERFVVASELDASQTDAIGRDLSGLIGVPFETTSNDW